MVAASTIFFRSFPSMKYFTPSASVSTSTFFSSARVWMPPESLPALGSVNANALIWPAEISRKKQFVRLGAPVKFGDDGFRARTQRIQRLERFLQFALERDEIGAQARAAGIHEMREKLARDGAQHRFAANLGF